MDAKPQRPVRTLRVYGDENIAPAIGPQKTIHQRNKSSPALSTMAQAGGLRAAAKRTAFGDLSNAANVSRPSKDDTSIPVKANGTTLDKPVAVIAQEKRSTALLRPAQRPLSVSGLKSLLHNVSSSQSQVGAKQAPIEIQQPTQPSFQQANTKKLAAKKSTAVFKDAAINRADQSRAENEIPKLVPLPPVHRELVPSQQTQEPKLAKDSKVDPELPLVTIREGPAPLRIGEESSNTLPSSEEAAPCRSDGIYIDKHGEIQQYVFKEESETKDNQVSEPVEAPQTAAEESLADRVDRYRKERDEQLDAGVGVKQTLLPVSEPELYWDEEDGTYEEEGYVTARSFKSRGENTTSGVTTVLFPKVNQKIKKELAAAKEMVESTRTAEDIDDETWDTSMVAEYGDEIFGYMRDLEIKMLPNAHYMDNQAEIQWSMRSVLMGWLVQVHHRFGLLPETLFLCVNYIDRFLSCKVVSLGKLQLVGATAIFVAAKYEEISCPSVHEIVYMVDGGYSVDEVLKAERFMLSMLQFELGWPGPMSFLRRISKADDYDLETRTLAKYFLELTIMDERMMLKKGHWSAQHTYYSNYTYTQLYHLVLLIVECCEDPRKHHPDIFDKYTDKRYKRASLFAETEMRRGFQILDINTHNVVSLPEPREASDFWRLKA
ncbi:MAG: hypothetical protein Q9188_004171 [Gyalolechia gomerana]